MAPLLRATDYQCACVDFKANRKYYLDTISEDVVSGGNQSNVSKRMVKYVGHRESHLIAGGFLF